VLAPGFRTQSLSTEIRVRLNAGGQVLGTRVMRRSGNPWFDESVERAIKKASPLPPPPEADEWLFVFRPEDVL
jgi:colicin import membrane protein